jgi:Signal transduction histidine kinase
LEKILAWRSLRLKYALTNFVVLAVTLVLLNTYPLIVSQDLVFQAKEASLQSQAKVISSPLSGLKNLTEEGVGYVMEQLGNVGVTRAIITDASGWVLYDTAGELGKAALLREISVALAGSAVFHSAYSDETFYSWAAAPVTYRNAVIGAVYLYEADDQQGALIESIQNNFRNISLVIGCLTILISIAFSSALMRRMDSLLRAIRTVRDGGYSHRIALTGGDEITRLTENFNELAGRLETTEQVRQQFVSDASHELKTPLASIRLLSDSILHADNMKTEMVREFVSDIGNEAERLTRITEKLLTLTKLDSEVAMTTERISLPKILEKVTDTLAPLAAQSSVSIHLELHGEGSVIANDDDLHQIVFNLVENAVKYNVLGGHVWVILAESDRQVTVTVEDTGVGIPEEERSKVFDRFYRVDKARSRTAGGTGLGLSIARDLARQHGGTIEVQQRTGGGSVFRLTLPDGKEVAGA